MVKFEKKKPTGEELRQLGVERWDMWTKEVSDFDWEYDEKETFYVLEGKAEIESDDERLSFSSGDLVICYPGTKCVWHVMEPIKKRYSFG